MRGDCWAYAMAARAKVEISRSLIVCRIAYHSARMRIRTALMLAAALLPAQDKPQYTFGTTVVSNAWLQGQIYDLKPGIERLPRLDRMKPAGTIYTNTLNIWPQRFDQGFPGITDRFEWFAIDY